MDTWRWLTEPSHIPIFVAIVGVVAGVLGGTLSQVVAGLFKRSGETRQLAAEKSRADAAEIRWQKEQDFERERWKSDQEFARTQYLLDARREAYVRFLSTASKHAALLHEYVHGKDVYSPKERVLLLYSNLQLLDALVSEVALYGQSIGEKARVLVLSMPDITALTPDNLNDQMKKWKENFRILRGMMQTAIGIEDSWFNSHNQPQLNEAPVSGENKPIKP